MLRIPAARAWSEWPAQGALIYLKLILGIIITFLAGSHILQYFTK
jgi:hypothetical protein